MKNIKAIKEFSSQKVFYLTSVILLFPIAFVFFTKISSIDYINIRSLISVLLSFFLVDFVIKSSEGLFSYYSIKLSSSFKFVSFILFSFGLSIVIAIFGVKIDFLYFIIGLLVVSNTLFFKNEKK